LLLVACCSTVEIHDSFFKVVDIRLIIDSLFWQLYAIVSIRSSHSISNYNSKRVPSHCISSESGAYISI